MSKKEWYTKPIYLLVALALVLSVGITALPVAGTNGCCQDAWVDDDADPGFYNMTCHFDTIQKGVDALCENGTVVHVLAGTYTQAVTIPPGANLTIQGAGRDITTWIAPADHPSRMHCVECALSGCTGNTTLDISGFTFSVQDNAISTGGIAILINRATIGPLYLAVHDNKFIETTTIASETANSMLLCHNRYAARDAGEGPVKIYNNLDYTTGGICMSNTRAFDIYDNSFDGGSDALYIGYGCPTGTTIGDHHIYNNTFKNASNAYPGGPWPSIFFSYYGSGTGMTFLPSTMDCNTFEDNDIAIGYDMESNITYPDDVIRHNHFENNDEAMRVWGMQATTVNATLNWWADESGPYDPAGTTEVPPCTAYPTAEKNADGSGDKVSSNVDYCPWLKAPIPLGVILYELCVEIDGLSADDFNNAKAGAGQQQALLNKVDAVFEQIEAGAYNGAINKLQNDVRDKIEKWIIGDERPELIQKVNDIVAILDDLLE